MGIKCNPDPHVSCFLHLPVHVTLKKLHFPWLSLERSYEKFLKKFKAGVWISSQQLSEAMDRAQEPSFLSLWCPLLALKGLCSPLLPPGFVLDPRPCESPCSGLSSLGVQWRGSHGEYREARCSTRQQVPRTGLWLVSARGPIPF